MDMETRGVVLMVWGKRGYGFAAYNLAVSLKYHSPSIPITLIAQKETLSQVNDHSVFDSIIYTTDIVHDPGRFKAGIYKMLPYDYNLYLDVDAFCFKPIDPLFDSLIAKGGHYYTFIQAMYDQYSPNLLPQMYWAWKDDIWQHYGLTDHQLPACQSSVQFIKKCEESKELFELVEKCFDDPIPLDRLRHQWGGTQPDELYLNIALAIKGIAPHIGDDAMWFGNNGSKRPRQISHLYYILSFFGYKNNIKNFFWDFYDATLIKMCASRGGNHIYKQQYIKADKHANKNTMLRTTVRKQAPVTPLPSVHFPVFAKGDIHLFVSYFQTGDQRRDQELNRVMDMNISCPSINRIINLGSPYNHQKVTTIPFERPTYKDFVNAVNEHGSDYNIIANSDIYFTDEIEKIKSLDFHNTALALSRYDCRGSIKKLFNYEYSQDTWVIKGKVKPIENIDFIMGKPGCDNRFAYELSTAGYRVINPSVDIKTYHLHEVNKRSYVESERIHGNYLPVQAEPMTNYMLKKVLIHQPGKVGDILICLPIAKKYADQGYVVQWLCPIQYHHLFRYVDYVTPIEVKQGTYYKEIDLSFGIIQNTSTHVWWMKNRQDFKTFVHAKYHLSGVDAKERYNLNYTRDEKSENELFDYLGLSDSEDYILFHPSSDYGGAAPVPDSKGLRMVVFEPKESYTLFDWRKVVENAKEIHCIDSSLANLVEVINPPGERFFYRLAARNTESWFDFEKWNVIEVNKLIPA